MWCLRPGRRPTIPEDIRERLYGYLGGIARENGIPALAVGGAADHVHLLLSLPRTVSVAKAVQLLKVALFLARVTLSGEVNFPAGPLGLGFSRRLFS